MGWDELSSASHWNIPIWLTSTIGLLGTKDAHGVYANLGFKALEEPHRFMQLKRPPVL